MFQDRCLAESGVQQSQTEAAEREVPFRLHSYAWRSPFSLAPCCHAATATTGERFYLSLAKESEREALQLAVPSQAPRKEWSVPICRRSAIPHLSSWGKTLPVPSPFPS